MHSASTGAPTYSAEQYAADCGALPIAKSVHIEAMASDGAAETAYTRLLTAHPLHPLHPLPLCPLRLRYIEALARGDACKVAAIVANCNLAAPDVEQQLGKIKAASARVRGIRYLLN